ncbi:hypothetical protein BH09BAC1_BH09BAC1_10900 [soil metagenome]
MNSIKTSLFALTLVCTLGFMACSDTKKDDDKIIEVESHDRLIERDKDKVDVDVDHDGGKVHVDLNSDKKKVDVEIGKDDKK